MSVGICGYFFKVQVFKFLWQVHIQPYLFFLFPFPEMSASSLPKAVLLSPASTHLHAAYSTAVNRIKFEEVNSSSDFFSYI